MSKQIARYIGAVKRWWWLFVISALIPALLTGFFFSRRPDTYRARATLVIGSSLQNPNPDPWQLSVANNLANAYARLAREGPVLEAVIAQLGLVDRRPEQLAAQIATRVYPEAQLLEIEVVDTNPRAAALIANALADELVRRSPVSQEDQAQRQAFIRRQLDDLEARIERLDEVITELQTSLVELTSAAELEEAQNRLGQLEAAKADHQATYASLLDSYRMESPNVVSLFDPAVEPVAPLPRRDKLFIAVAGVVGLLLAATGVFLIEYMDDAVRWQGRWEREMEGIPILGIVPKVKVGKSALATSLRFRQVEIEAIRSLRTALMRAGQDQRPGVVLVTSPGVGEGKTFTVTNLGMSIATTGLRVIVVDANMRSPRLHEWFDQPNGRGLSELLSGEATIPTSWPPVELRATGINNLYLLPSGRPPADPAALLTVGQLVPLIQTLREYADVVLIDSPAGTVAPDAMLLASVAERVVLVCCEGRTRRQSVVLMKEVLSDGRAEGRLGIAFARVKVGGGQLYGSTARLLGPDDAGWPVMLTLAEAATLLGVSKATVGRWCRTGRLPATRKRWRWLIPREDLKRFAAAYFEVPEAAGAEEGGLELALPTRAEMPPVAHSEDGLDEAGEVVDSPR
ncbi:MAG TPA: helix-turn-helix domain-containing protein [Anaerolineales bacterium]|nr:helix-turn-helix domain-containing protein [Anaerolineae bacterium]HIQ00988.1 helix-turn-helix domain-containing protein [Anaerolineales bacterium]